MAHVRFNLVTIISSTLFIILIMKQTLLSTYIVLITLTLVAAFISFKVNSKIIVTMVISLSLIKFWLVAFQFMELKTAHAFWKYLLLAFGGFLALILIVLL